MPNGEYEPRRPHRSNEENTRDYLEAKIDGNRQLSDAKFTSQETAVSAALIAAEKAVNAALAASEKAIAKAEAAQTRVNEGQNEFRLTLKDQASTLMPRAETELLLREIRGTIVAISDQLNSLRSRVDIGPPSLGVLQARSDESVGANRNSQQTKASILAIVAIGAGAAGALLNHFLK